MLGIIMNEDSINFPCETFLSFYYIVLLLNGMTEIISSKTGLRHPNPGEVHGL